MTNISLLVSTPSCDIGELTLIDKILMAKNVVINSADQILCIKTEFIEAATRIEGYLIFVPTEDAIEKITVAGGY